MLQRYAQRIARVFNRLERPETRMSFRVRKTTTNYHGASNVSHGVRVVRLGPFSETLKTSHFRKLSDAYMELHGDLRDADLHAAFVEPQVIPIENADGTTHFQIRLVALREELLDEIVRHLKTAIGPKQPTR